MKSPSKKKQQKFATVKARQHTYDGWKAFVTELGYYDAKYEQEKYQMKEYNLTNHFLNALELMAQLKGQQFTEDSFTITLIEMNRQRNKTIQTPEQLKLFLTAFLTSFNNLVTFSNELSFFTRLVDPNELPNQLPSLISFYLKVRKYVVHNFVNERESQQKPLNFEQWVSVVSRFLDNKAIVTIGNQIKEKASQTNNNEKIMENNIEFFDLIVLCYEEQEKRLKKAKKDTNQNNEKTVQKQESSEQKNEQLRASVQEETDNYYEPKQASKAHRIAYNLAMGPPSSLKKSREKEPESVYEDYTPVNDKHEKHDRLESQHKMIAQLHDSKHKMMEDMMRQSQAFGECLRIHENLAINYKYIANFTQDLQNLVSTLVTRIRSGQAINEIELRLLEKHSQFDEFLPEDPEVTLSKTGIYEFMRRN